jgi:hypothetical protein
VAFLINSAYSSSASMIGCLGDPPCPCAVLSPATLLANLFSKLTSHTLAC